MARRNENNGNGSDRRRNIYTTPPFFPPSRGRRTRGKSFPVSATKWHTRACTFLRIYGGALSLSRFFERVPAGSTPLVPQTSTVKYLIAVYRVTLRLSVATFPSLRASAQSGTSPAAACFVSRKYQVVPRRYEPQEPLVARKFRQVARYASPCRAKHSAANLCLPAAE